MMGGMQEVSCAMLSEVSETSNANSRGQRWGRSALDGGPSKSRVSRPPRATSLDLTPKSAASETLFSTTGREKSGPRHAKHAGRSGLAAPLAARSDTASTPPASGRATHSSCGLPKPKDNQNHEAAIGPKTGLTMGRSSPSRHHPPTTTINDISDDPDDPDIADRLADDFILTRLSPCFGSSAPVLPSGPSWPMFSPGSGTVDAVDALVENFSYSLHPDATPDELCKIVETFPLYGTAVANPIPSGSNRFSDSGAVPSRAEPSLTSCVSSRHVHGDPAAIPCHKEHAHSDRGATTAPWTGDQGNGSSCDRSSLASDHSSGRQGPARRTPRGSQDSVRRMDFCCPPSELLFSGSTRQQLLREIYGPGSSMGNEFSDTSRGGLIDTSRRRGCEMPHNGLTTSHAPALG